MASFDGAHWLALAAQEGALPVDLVHMVMACGVVALESAVAHYLEVGLADQLLVAGIRAFIQLNLLGYVLAPIFSSDNACIVLLYIFGFMVLVSAYEASARPKMTYPNLFQNAVATTALAIFVPGTIMLFIVMPTPWYNAQYLIPVAGMLLSNALTGNALALNGMLEHLTTRKDQVEILLAFGGSKWESIWPGFTNIFRAALIPGINGMNVIGLVSIPGMMTGQILGGSSPQTASRYQLVITILISGSNFISVLFIMLLTVRSLFDSRGRLDSARLTLQKRLKVAQLFSPSEWKKRRERWRKTGEDASGSPSSGAEPLLSAPQGSAPASLELQLAKSYNVSATRGKDVLLDIRIDGFIGDNRDISVRLQLHENETAVIMGPSGIGKSTILRMLSDLQPQRSDATTLQGLLMSATGAQEWRRDVLYIHQAKSPLPDSPRDLVNTIQRFKVRAGRGPLELQPLLVGVGLSEEYLDKPWNKLSGGESQRVMLAIGLATKPRVILLDEPTSALDDESKRLVEDAVLKVECAVVWVTHDDRQARRIGDSIWKLAERQAGPCAAA